MGRFIDSAYRIQRLIGTGGMGKVYEAEQAALGRTVAVKVVHPHLLSDEQTVARFYGEARASSRLNHPNSISIIDFGRTEDGLLYLVMEYLRGEPLSSVVGADGLLTFERMCNILADVLEGLGEAHALDVVHRDLKPDNIIVSKTHSGADVVKVVDFGLATIVDGSRESLTLPGLVCGTPHYMAPEQCAGEPVDGRTDIYALGAVLYELLTGRTPFVGDSPTKILLQHLHDDVPDPRDLAPARDIPETLADIALKALRKDPGARFQTAREMQQALQYRRQSSRHSSPSGRVRCRTCGEVSELLTRFCGACGEPMAHYSTNAPSWSIPPARQSSGRPPAPWIGHNQRVDDLVRRLKAPTGIKSLGVVGETGVGKSRLLREFAMHARAGGDLVAVGLPHPTGAYVPYAPIKELFCALLDTDAQNVDKAAAERPEFDVPLARAGIRELLSGRQSTPKGRRLPRSGAVAQALAVATRVGMDRTGARNAFVMLDDADRCDALSREVMMHLQGADPSLPVAIVVASSRKQDVAMLDEVKTLKALTPDTGYALLNRLKYGTEITAVAPQIESLSLTTSVTPLLVTQLAALRLDLNQGIRLADAIGQRLERLNAGERRLVQAAAVLGYRCTVGRLAEIVSPEDMKHLDSLTQSGWLLRQQFFLEIFHPFARDFLLNSIPAGARRELHRTALKLAAHHGEPLETRAEHALGSGDVISSLVLLEKVGDLALGRMDPESAALAYRRGLEVARREMLEAGTDGMERAIVQFSAKLGQSLEEMGAFQSASGVLKEALDLTGPNDTVAVQMLMSLGRIEAHRQRHAPSRALLHQAAERAKSSGDAALEAAVYVASAAVAVAGGRTEEAVVLYRQASALYEERSVAMDPGGEIRLDLADALIEMGRMREAAMEIERASEQIGRSGDPALRARGRGALGRLSELSGQMRQAYERYQEAAALASEAGDAQSYARWRDALDALSGRPPSAVSA